MWEELVKLSWQPDSRSESLHVVYCRAVEQVRASAAWYDSRRSSKRRWAMCLRVGAIALGSVAAVLPLFSQIFLDRGKPIIQPVWASVALVLAAALVALDRYFGFSSAWMRFMMSELSLNSLISDFELVWHGERAAWLDGVPDDQQVQRALSGVREFVDSAASLVRDETSSWIKAFQAELKELDDSMRARTAHT
jgi:hypothetical protein